MKMDYVDLFILPVPKRNLPKYRKIAQKFAAVIKDYGALDYREFVGDDLYPEGISHWPSRITLKKGEVLIGSYVLYRSRAHRDQVNKRAMADPRMQKLMKEKPLFDMKKMLYGGFKTFIRMP